MGVPMLTPLQIAEVCHDANRAYSRHAQSYSSVRWERLTAENQQRVVDGVMFVMENPNATPEECHDHWCATMLKNGWTPGGVLDLGAKVHPNLRPWDALLLREQLKDELFLGIVKACLLPLRRILAESEGGAGDVTGGDSSVPPVSDSEESPPPAAADGALAPDEQIG